jgi:hypothetical protein
MFSYLFPTKFPHRHGSLKIPAGTQIFQVEPAIEMQITPAQSATLFIGPPDHPKSKYQKITETGGVIGKETEPFFVQQELKKSTTVLARPPEQSWKFGDKRPASKPHVMHVETMDSDAKEKVDGYVFMDDLVFTKEEYKKTKEDIFSKSPSIDSIKQGNLGNCFLLSAINSILTHPEGEKFILGMMLQMEDQTTIVRLYDPRTLMPVYIQVENSVLQNASMPASDHSELWVHLLEKAFAGLGMERNEPKKKAKASESETKDSQSAPVKKLLSSSSKYRVGSPSFYGMYDEGGYVDDALTILTGQEAKLFFVNRYSHQQLFADLSRILNEEKGLLTANAYKHLSSDSSKLEADHAYAITRVYKKTDQLGKELLMVRVRNPHGDVSNTSAEIDLEISDFARYFQHYAVGKLPGLSPKLEALQTTQNKQSVTTTQERKKLS